MRPEPKSLRDYNLTSLFRFPEVLITEQLARDWAGHLQTLLGLSGLSIVFPSEGTVLCRKEYGQQEITRIIIQEDRIEIEHARVGKLGLDMYKRNVEGLAKAAFEVIKIPFIYEQVHTISKICTMSGNEDSRRFLAEKVASIQENRLIPFGRPLFGVGLQFAFPPIEDEKPLCEIEAKIQSFTRNPRELFLLAKGRFPCLPPISSKSILEVPAALDYLQAFIEGKIMEFLAQFGTEEGEQ